MSITSDIRSYADTALGQGKQVLDQAQTQLSGVTGQANEFVSDWTNKATDAVTDLRSQAEKAINLEAIKAAIEPYLAQAKGYSTTVTDRAEELYSSVKSDKRVAAVVTRAEALTGVVVETVQERVVKPVQSLTGLGATKATPARPAATPAVTKPVAKRAPAKKAPAKKATAKA
jgi:ElaB/YqjD/DUF883 family membrane-anchored ribosome-binding protein